MGSSIARAHVTLLWSHTVSLFNVGIAWLLMICSSHNASSPAESRQKCVAVSHVVVGLLPLGRH